jgi:hypothetical protein
VVVPDPPRCPRRLHLRDLRAAIERNNRNDGAGRLEGRGDADRARRRRHRTPADDIAA